MFEQITVIVASLVGFSIFVSFLVNVGKFLGVVKDGDSDKWVKGLNLAGVIALYIMVTINPEFDVTPIDNILYEIATVGGALLSYLIMIFGSKLTYIGTKGTPIIGYTFSPDA